MAETLNTESMVRDLEALLGKPDTPLWDGCFVLSMRHARIECRLNRLSKLQIKRLEELHNKYFGA